MKICTRILPLLAFLAALASCGKEEAKLESLSLNKDSVALVGGETVQLIAMPKPSGVVISPSWSSSDPDVATVSASGLVRGVDTGSARITVSALGKTAVCNVSVQGDSPSAGPAGDGYLDPRDALALPLNSNLIHSLGTQLARKSNVMQGWDFTDASHYYYSQAPANLYSQYISFVPGPSQGCSNYMTLERFGHMTQIVAEKASDGKTYIWCNSNGQAMSDGYGNSLSISRLEYKAGETLSGGYAGDMFIMSKQYSGKPYVDLQVSVDFDYRRLLVGGRVSGVNTRFHWVYDLDEVLALPLKDVTLTVSVGGYLDGDGEARKVTRSFKARDLSDAKQLGYFEVPRGADPTKTYYYSHQGHAVYGNYVWFYEGEALSDAHPSLAFITVYDYNGKVVIPRTEVAALKDSDLMRKLGFTYDGSAEAESLKIKDGVLYLGFTGHSSAASSNRIQNILKYDLN
ncbi:MAG: Ig-like domain-containing protein [Bacteroidales bacterium]|nr:Ig-like domain-containing protein [Bacteroidales bacterium]